MPTVAIDVSEASVLPLRGWNRYVVELLGALQNGAGEGLDVRPLAGSGSGPELLWEQIGLPRALRRERAAAVHSPNCFLPLRRPCPGVVTIHDLAFEVYPDDFSAKTGWKYRTFTRRAARSAERIICDSSHSADDVSERYGVDREQDPRDPARARAAGGRRPGARGPVPAGGGRPARQEGPADARARLEDAARRRPSASAGARRGGRRRGGALRAAAGDEPLEITGYLDDAESMR